MARRIRFTQRAIDDLAEIRDYLIKRSAAGADNVRAHIAGTLDSLAYFPFIGRATDQSGVRVLPLTRYPYLIFYMVHGSEIVVLHIRHGSRQPMRSNDL
ncbi:MAG: type II toxin-antitoxin system RelE/ParE family toxin [Rhizobiales bacterium]|nr:type II toxin-antitoxin system RelE/ParE family toxin [Hyphomicrobiales bacterium]